MPHLTTTDSDVYCSPTGAPNVRFISSKVRTAAAIEEYNEQG